MSNAPIFIESTANPNNHPVNIALCTYMRKCIIHGMFVIEFGGIADGDKNFFWIYDIKEERERDYQRCLSAGKQHAT